MGAQARRQFLVTADFHFPLFLSHNAEYLATKELRACMQMCKIKATTHLTRNADYKFSEKFQQKREAPQLHFIQIVSIL